MKKILIIIIISFIFINNVSAKSFITLPNQINEVGIHIKKNTISLEKLNNYFEFKDNDFYNSITGLLATSTKRIIDISSHQKEIDFGITSHYIDGVIVRIGYGNNLDNKFEEYINEIKKYNIPYGIYLYSYAENSWEAKNEANFTIDTINKYNLEPTLGIFYDIEEFYIKGKKINISSNRYEKIISKFINTMNQNQYQNVGVYTNTKLYKKKLNNNTKKYVTWIAQYNNYFYYQNNFKIWQYTDHGKVPGINGNVDINVMFD